MKLSVVIVNWNGGALVVKCLSTLLRSKTPFPFEILVVDNNSSDRSPQEIKKKFPQVKLLRMRRNLGFGKANNTGAKRCKGEYILFLNPDTEVKRDTLRTVVEHMEKNTDVGILGCKVFYPNGTLQRSAYRRFPGIRSHLIEYNFLLRSLLYKLGLPFGEIAFEKSSFNRVLDAKHLLGAFLLVRKGDFEQLGSFDERFFLYREETDLCLRYLKAGFKVRYIPTTSIIHHMGAITGVAFTPGSKYYMGSTYKFFRKHWGRIYMTLAWIVAVLSLIFNLVFLAFPRLIIFKRYQKWDGGFLIRKNLRMLLWHLTNLGKELR